MRKMITIAALIVAGVFVYWLVGISNEESALIASNTNIGGQAPINGKKLYEENCASCHGINAQGTENGPPFLHKVYESSHHSDAAFLMAPKRGVRAHHWKFGDMPPVPSVNDAEVMAITKYIRQLQRMVGIK